MSNDNVASLFNVRSHNPSFFAVKDSVAYKGELLDFCIPVNLHFPPAALVEMIHQHLGEILRYYPDYAEVHQQHLGEMTGLAPETIVPCNGSTEIITMLCQEAKDAIVTSIPTFSRWTDLPEELHVPLFTIARRRENEFRLEVDEIVRRVREVKARTLVISNPNNPTGAWLTLEEIRTLAHELRDLDAVIVDESFIDFSDLETAAAFAAGTPNLVVVKSMGKSLGWHGVRLGYAATEPRRAQAMRARLPFWNINGLAAFVLKNVTRFKPEYFQSFAKVAEDRIYMTKQLSSVPGLRIYPSKANFLFVELPDGMSGRTLRDRLLKNYGLMVRECSNKIGSSEQYLRLAVQGKQAVDSLIRALHDELEGFRTSCGSLAAQRGKASPFHGIHFARVGNTQRGNRLFAEKTAREVMKVNGAVVRLYRKATAKGIIMSEQESQKRGIRSEAQKAERAREGYDSIPPSNAVAGAYGDRKRETPTDQDVSLSQSVKKARRERSTE